MSNEKPAKDDYDETLDVYSESFDPLKALLSDNVVLPVPKAKVFDNIAKYHSVKDPEKKRNQRPKKSSLQSPAIVRRFLPHQMPVPSKRKPQKNILTKLHSTKGPLKVLADALIAKQKCIIKVHTRDVTRIKGYFEGVLLLFDKHWNLAMENVTEVWTRKIQKKAAPPAGGARIKWNPLRLIPPTVKVVALTRKTEVCVRKVGRVFLRGQHVACIKIVSLNCGDKAAAEYKTKV